MSGAVPAGPPSNWVFVPLSAPQPPVPSHEEAEPRRGMVWKRRLQACSASRTAVLFAGRSTIRRRSERPHRRYVPIAPRYCPGVAPCWSWLGTAFEPAGITVLSKHSPNTGATPRQQTRDRPNRAETIRRETGGAPISSSLHDAVMEFGDAVFVRRRPEQLEGVRIVRIRKEPDAAAEQAGDQAQS